MVIVGGHFSEIMENTTNAEQCSMSKARDLSTRLLLTLVTRKKKQLNLSDEEAIEDKQN